MHGIQTDGIRPDSRPILIGEVLFDCFDDGREVLGGAPFNVAWHLHAFGLAPLLISRVGDDPRGRHVGEMMARWGMDRSGIQQDQHHPTGSVRITMHGHTHRFEILPEQAYDFLDTESVLVLIERQAAALLYTGSLIERSPVSRAAVTSACSLGIPRFVDVNLRQPWWRMEAVHGLLQGVHWAKLNEEELQALGFVGEPEVAARQMQKQFGFVQLILTRGADGALLLDGDKLLDGKPVVVARLVDTVGAGDAFSAVWILGLLRGWPTGLTLRRALAFAARQCEVRGAIREDKAFYQDWLQRWEGQG